ncbi:hypothetical protein [Pseudonocardia sp. T1-2H]|uniref:hypothetical protein n=1 Tax=Pseudonocardia sp. T1-2H TaxID=3128899 RepID=UPI003100C277
MTKSNPRRVRDISELDEHALRCTLYRRHSFPLPVFVPTWLDEHQALRADLKCDCGTRRVVYISPRTFEEWSSYYVHPDDYLVEGGRPGHDDAWKEAKRRQTAAQTKAAAREQRDYDRAAQRQLRAVS